MSQPPTSIRALQDEGELEITWQDGSVHHLPFKDLRCQCPCASCVDELSGRRTLDVDSIPESIKPMDMQFSGNYAVKITWNDGHNTGLYTWDHLQRIGRGQ